MPARRRVRRPQSPIRRQIRSKIAERARPCRLRGVPTPVRYRSSSPRLQPAAWMSTRFRTFSWPRTHTRRRLPVSIRRRLTASARASSALWPVAVVSRTRKFRKRHQFSLSRSSFMKLPISMTVDTPVLGLFGSKVTLSKSASRCLRSASSKLSL